MSDSQPPGELSGLPAHRALDADCPTVDGAPVYHRRQGRGQSYVTAFLQLASGEVWGYGLAPAMGGAFPKVQAYRGPLPDQYPGIEFVTGVPVDATAPPGRPEWSPARTPFVVRRVDANDEVFAVLRCVRFTKNTSLPPPMGE